jgi:hypothetical protein
MEESVGSNPNLAKASNSERPPPWLHPPLQHLGIVSPHPPTILDGGIIFFLKISLPGSFDEMPTVHKQILAKPHHGKTHKLLVPTLEASFPTINAASFAKVQGDKTLKKSSIHSPQTTQSQCIHRNQLGMTSHGMRQTPQLLYLESVLQGIPHVPQRAPKHLGACPKNRSVEVLR